MPSIHLFFYRNHHHQGGSTHRSGEHARTHRSALATARSHASNRSRTSVRSRASRSIDPQESKSILPWAQWRRFAKHQAAKRRHPGLVYFEALDAIGNEEDELKMLEQDRARIRKRRQASSTR